MKFSYNQKIKKLKLDRNSENEIIDITGFSCFEISIRLDETFNSFNDLANIFSNNLLSLNNKIKGKLEKFNFDSSSFSIEIKKDEFFSYLVFYSERHINENELEFVKTFWKENIKEEELSMCGGTIREI